MATAKPAYVPQNLWDRAHNATNPEARRRAQAAIAELTRQQTTTPTADAPRMRDLAVSPAGPNLSGGQGTVVRSDGLATPTKAVSGVVAGSPAQAAPGEGFTAEQTDALEQVRAQLDSYGLGGLAEFAWNAIQQGRSAAEVIRDLQKTPEFQAEFPEIGVQRNTGQYVMTPAEIINYRRQATDIAKAAGLPSGFYDQKSDFTRLINGGVSLNEFAQRAAAAQRVAYQMPADVRAQFSDTLGIGDFTALAFDPTTALPLLERKVSEAEALTAAARSGYGMLNENERQTVAQSGLSFAQQQQAFGELTDNAELFTVLDSSETLIGRSEQIGATFAGDANARRRIQDRAGKRKATFQGSSGFGATQEGVKGLAVS